jgi:hypothetical protein
MSPVRLFVCNIHSHTPIYIYIYIYIFIHKYTLNICIYVTCETVYMQHPKSLLAVMNLKKMSTINKQKTRHKSDYHHVIHINTYKPDGSMHTYKINFYQKIYTHLEGMRSYPPPLFLRPHRKSNTDISYPPLPRAPDPLQPS